MPFRERSGDPKRLELRLEVGMGLPFAVSGLRMVPDVALGGQDPRAGDLDGTEDGLVSYCFTREMFLNRISSAGTPEERVRAASSVTDRSKSGVVMSAS